MVFVLGIYRPSRSWSPMRSVAAIGEHRFRARVYVRQRRRRLMHTCDAGEIREIIHYVRGRTRLATRPSAPRSRTHATSFTCNSRGASRRLRAHYGGSVICTPPPPPSSAYIRVSETSRCRRRLTTPCVMRPLLQNRSIRRARHGDPVVFSLGRWLRC